jgi:hypothetical protein
MRSRGDAVANVESSPFASRGFVVSAAVIGLVVIFAVAVILTGGSGSRPRTRAATGTAGVAHAAPGAESHAVSMGTGGSECGLAAGSQAVPTTAPSPSQWVLVGSMAVPSSPRTIGPGRSVDGFAECFAHSPTGALFALVNFWAAGTALPPSDVYSHLAADTPARAQAVRFSAGDGSRLSDSGQVQVAGFDFSSYSSSEADISVVLQSSDGNLVTVACTMLWQAGDWRYEIPPSGAPAAGQIQSLDGYVPWSDAS